MGMATKLISVQNPKSRRTCERKAIVDFHVNETTITESSLPLDLSFQNATATSCTIILPPLFRSHMLTLSLRLFQRWLRKDRASRAPARFRNGAASTGATWPGPSGWTTTGWRTSGTWRRWWTGCWSSRSGWGGSTFRSTTSPRSTT